jgi:6-phosphogluconolactonase
MQIHLYENGEEMSAAAAEWIVLQIEKRLQSSDRFSFLLSGGNTPKQLYRLLSSQQYSNKIDWEKVDVFFGDERVVPFEDERNNGKMALDTLLSKVPIPQEQIHFIDTTNKPEEAALQYDQFLHGYFENSAFTFDLALLGMGEDGHTLSIFPGMESKLDISSWVISTYLPSQQIFRVSLTPLVVNLSRTIAFLVSGAGKKPVVKKILNENSSISYPAQLIKPGTGELHWFLDKAAYTAD